MKHLPASVPVVILTPLASERRAVAQHLTELRQEFFENDLYETGYFKGLHHEYVITLRETGPKNTQIALATQKAIRLFHPTLLLLTGIAGGVKDVRIGDLVVGTRAYGYESGKETDDGPLSRPDVLPFSKELIEVARMVGRAAHWRQRSTDKAPDAAVLFGPIASGDKVIASTASPLYHYLKRHFNDTLALEMESIGFAQAAAPHRNVFALNIRGVSDLLDHKSEGDETARQQMAAERAAAFVFELLYQLDCSPFMLPDMDPKTIAKEIYNLLFPMPASFKEIGNDFSHAANNEVREIWKKVKPLFIEEVEELANDPEDGDAQAGVRNRLKKELANKPELAAQLVGLLSIIETQNKPTGVSQNFVNNGAIENIGNSGIVEGDLNISLR